MENNDQDKNRRGNNIEREDPVIVFPSSNNQRIGSDVTQVAGERGSEIFSNVFKTLDTSNGLGRQTLVSGLPYCICGKLITPQDSGRCSHCNKLVCSSCVIEYEFELHCENCFRIHHFNIRKPSFLLLLCMEHGITNESDINELTGIPKDRIKSLTDNMASFTIRKKVLFGLLKNEIRLSDIGRDALYSYEKVYGNDKDVVTVKNRIEQILLKLSIQKQTKNDGKNTEGSGIQRIQ
jgi:hypothetical protein